MSVLVFGSGDLAGSYFPYSHYGPNATYQWSDLFEVLHSNLVKVGGFVVQVVPRVCFIYQPNSMFNSSDRSNVLSLVHSSLVQCYFYVFQTRARRE